MALGVQQEEQEGWGVFFLSKYPTISNECQFEMANEFA
jgi:hypothetical protein